MVKKKVWMVRDTSDDTQSKESGQGKRWWEKWWSNRKGKKVHDGGGGESKGGRTAKKMAKEAFTVKQWASFEVVQLEFGTMRTKPEGLKRKAAQRRNAQGQGGVWGTWT